MTYEITFPDGRVVSAGAAGAAIRSLKRTDSAFSAPDVQPGGVCAGLLEAEFFDDGLTLSAGDVLKFWEDGVLAGTYIAHAPTTPDLGLRRVAAYDFVTKLDTDLTAWLESLTDWPYALGEFAHMVCAACGLTLSGTLANESWPVPQFRGKGVTGRQLMQWVCQAGCRFCRAEPDGTLKLDWVSDAGLTLTDRDIFQGSLTLADYATDPIGGVTVALSAGDVGISYPESHPNSLTVRGNYLLSGCGEGEAREILEALGDLRHTPCSFRTPVALKPGQRFTLRTARGEFTALAMTVEQTGPLFSVSSTGEKSRSAAQSLCSYQALSGRVLEHEMTLQGVQTRLASFEDGDERYSQISQDVSSITLRVEDVEERCSELSLDAGSITARVEDVEGRCSQLRLDADSLTARVEAVEETGQQNYSQLRMDANSITARVGAVESAMEQNYSELRLDADGLSLLVGNMDGKLAQKADGSRVEALETHFRFDGNGLTISNNTTGMGIGISETQVAFTGGTDPTTIITPNRMHTTDLQVLDRLEVGDFALFPRTNGNLSLRAVSD